MMVQIKAAPAMAKRFHLRTSPIVQGVRGGRYVNVWMPDGLRPKPPYEQAATSADTVCDARERRGAGELLSGRS